MEIIKEEKRHDVAKKSDRLRTTIDTRLRDINGNKVPPAVDMIYSCIKHYRAIATQQTALKMPVTHAVKSIFISQKYWNQFEYWYRKMLPVDQADSEVKMITFMGVSIQKAPKYHPKEFYVEFYPTEQATC